MRNYIEVWFLNATIEDRLANGHLNGTFQNEFIGGSMDEINDAFGLYAQSFQGTHFYSLKNLEEAQPMFMLLSKDNILKMFALLSTAFSNVVSTWENPPGNFSGTVPDEAFFTSESVDTALFVSESPRKTWSNGE